MQVTLSGRSLRPGITSRGRTHTGRVYAHVSLLRNRRPFVAKAAIEAPPAAARAKLSEKHLQLLQQHQGPLVKIATHYHVGFGDCLKVIGSSEQLGAWKADNAPLMTWGEGDVWTLVLALPPGEHEFKIVVQQRSGNLVWEAGSDNRVVSVPEGAPVDSMITSVCAFNIIDTTAESKLQPVTADVLALLDAQLEEQAAAKAAQLAAEAERAAEEAEKARVVQAAAAVANAFATMDAEAEESGIRPRTLSESDDDEPAVSTPSRSRAGSAVVAASMTEAPAPVRPAPQEQAAVTEPSAEPAATAGRFEAAGLRSKQQAVSAADAQETVAAAAGRFEAAGLRSKKKDTNSVAAPPAAVEPAVSAAAEQEQKDQEQQQVMAHAAEEMEANLEEMSKEVHPDDVLASNSRAQSATAASVHAKLAQGKQPAVGFVKKSAPPGERQYTNSVVAAFMKSVNARGSPTPPEEPAQPAPAAAVESAAANPTTDSTPAAAAAAATPVKAALTVAESKADKPAADKPAPATPAGAETPAATDAGSAQPLPKGWGPSAGASRFPARTAASSATDNSVVSTGSPASSAPGPASVSTVASSSGLTGSSFSSSMASAAAGTPPNSPTRHKRPPSPGRGASHVVSAAAAAAVAAEWIENVRSNNVAEAAREAEKAAEELAAKLQAARQKKSEAAAESERLHESLKHSSMVKGVAVSSAGTAFGNGNGGAAAAASATTATTGSLGFMAAARSKVRGMTDAAATAVAATSSNPLSPPPITPAGGSSPAFTAASGAMAASAAAGVGPSPPPVVSTPSSTPRSVSKQAVSANSSSSGGAGALTASAETFNAASAESDVLETAEGGDKNWSDGMQFLAAVVGCAAVGTVLWSEFVLKDTGCGLPPGPYGLIGAAEGLSYLTVLGFAGAGVSARVQSGGKAGLQGPLVVPETMAYGAVAAGLMVLASQLYQYGYIPPPLPGGECFADSAVAEQINSQLGSQVAALQAILSQLQSAAADGANKLQLQQQLAILQAQVHHFSGYVSAQADVLNAEVSLGLFQLQDSLLNATDAVSSFVDTQMQQLDVSGKLSYVLDILRTQEQQLKVELPRQLAELQQLAATSMAVVQETAIQASSSAHLPQLLSSLDNVMAMLHGVLETRINQLDVVLTQLQGSIGAAAGQLAAAVAAAEQSGSQEAAAQLHGLQALLADAMSDVQAQVWAGYQQLALADKLSDMLLTVRTSAAAVASSTAAEVDKLRLQEQLQQLEGLAEASTSALAANAMDSLHKLKLEERLNDIATQASAAAASLQAGLKQQSAQLLPSMQAQMSALQANLADLAAKTDKQIGGSGTELETLLRQLGESMESTMRLVGEVASDGVTAAGDAVQGAGQSASSGLTAVSQQLGAATDAVSSGIATTFPQAAAPTAVSAVSASSPVVQAAAPAVSAVTASSAVVDVGAPLVGSVQDGAASMAAPLAAAVQESAPAATAVDAAAVTEAATKGAMAASLSAVSDFVVDQDAVAAAYAEAVEHGLDFSQLVAYALPDAENTLRQLPNAETYRVDGVNLTDNLRDASDTMKRIWFNRPQ